MDRVGVRFPSGPKVVRASSKGDRFPARRSRFDAGRESGTVHKLKVFTSENSKERAATALAELFERYKNVPMLFLASGGSAMALLPEKVEHTKLTVSVLDEHYVPDPKERNFEKLKQLPFHQSAVKAGAVFFDPYTGEVETAGKRFDSFLKDWLSTNPQGNIAATVGIGLDGHTMGIVPMIGEKKFRELFEQPETFAVGYKTPEGNAFPERLTSTYALLRKCADVIIYAAGTEKQAIVRKLLQSDAPYRQLPAVFLKTLTQADMYTDNVKFD